MISPKRYTFEQGEWKEIGEAQGKDDEQGLSPTPAYIDAKPPKPWRWDGDKWVSITKDEYKAMKGGIILMTSEDPNKKETE